MSKFDFDRLAILLVEDSPFIRSLLINSLKILGVGTVITKDHGGEAISFLKQVKEDPMKAGVMSVDLVISNWMMSPVDGMMLLRWVRRHKDSPDRFIPFVMISGFSSKRRVNEAREMGVTEFLTKPFTIQAICDKLSLIIQYPRQYVHTKDYFGPDRRRRKVEFEGEERRLLNDKSDCVEVIRG
jgi:CheY-like chemotaxis protein